jgi:hypothetical protein
MISRRARGWTAAAALAAYPRAADACAVCFGLGENSKGLAAGFWWGIVILLAVTMSLVGSIGYAVWSVERARGETPS